MANPELSAAVDRAVIEQFRTMADDAFVTELVDQFLDESAVLVETILAALDEGRVAVVATAAHSLKGSSATLGAIALSAICAEMEVHAREGGSDESARLSGALSGEYQSVRRELQRLSRPTEDELH